jgi:hypothetical protein
MRLSDRRVAQHVDSTPEVLVLVDDVNRTEITLNAAELVKLEVAIAYFRELGLLLPPAVTE